MSIETAEGSQHASALRRAGGRVSMAPMKKNGLKAAPGYDRASDAWSNRLATSL